MSEERKSPVYWWFEGASVAQMKAYFHDYDRPVQRVEVWRDADQILVQFIGADGETLGTVNDSHPCPPSCPDGGG